MIEYPRQTGLPEEYLKERIESFLREDAPEGDRTSEGTTIKSDMSTAQIQAQEDLILAAVPVIEYCFKDDFELEIYVKDGHKVSNGDIIAEISGSSSDILLKERVLLNLIQRMCGIATITSRYAEIVGKYNVKVLDTRKTTPGLRLFEKYSVAMGGGYNHRLDLSSGILIKDNHIKAAGGVFPAVEKIKKADYELPIELEVENYEQIKEGMEADVDGFLLDNMNPETVRRAVELIGKYTFGEKKFTEASGGITLGNIEEYAKTGVDAISVGALTHSVKCSDIHIEFD